MKLPVLCFLELSTESSFDPKSKQATRSNKKLGLGIPAGIPSEKKEKRGEAWACCGFSKTSSKKVLYRFLLLDCWNVEPRELETQEKHSFRSKV